MTSASTVAVSERFLKRRSDERANKSCKIHGEETWRGPPQIRSHDAELRAQSGGFSLSCFDHVMFHLLVFQSEADLRCLSVFVQFTVKIPPPYLSPSSPSIKRGEAAGAAKGVSRPTRTGGWGPPPLEGTSGGKMEEILLNGPF